MQKIHFSVFLTAVLLLSAACPGKQEGGFARIGEQQLDYLVVSERARMNMALGVPDPEIAAMADIILGMLADQVAAQFGLAMTEGAAQEHYRQLLAQPDSPLGEWAPDARDEQAFRTAAVLPSYAFMVLEQYYNQPDQVDGEALAMVHRLHARGMTDPVNFRTIAVAEDWPVETVWLGLHGFGEPPEGEVDATPKMNPKSIRDAGIEAESHAAAVKLYESLVGTPVGRVHPEPIMATDAYRLVRIDAHRNNALQLTVVTIPKLAFDEWFWSLAGRIPVFFIDLKAGRRFMDEVPWAGRMKVSHEQFPLRPAQ